MPNKCYNEDSNMSLTKPKRHWIRSEIGQEGRLAGYIWDRLFYA